MKSFVKTNMLRHTCGGVLLLALLSSAMCVQAQHGHLDAGAIGTNQSDPLLWVNGELFATNTGFSQPMTFATNGTYAGYFQSGPTLTASPATVANTGPAAFASALGSYLSVQVSLVDAPAGGSFAFWGAGSLTPLYSLNPGQATPLINLSAVGAGRPNADPYGHIHGRRFTASVLGDYLVGFQAFDVSTNGLNGGPIHVPSEMLFVRFSAVPEPATPFLLAVGLGLIGWCQRNARTRDNPKNL